MTLPAHHRIEPVPPPRLVFWELTAGCNLRCVHCRASAQPGRSPEELTTREALNVLEMLAEVPPGILVLTGGEPLYRPDLTIIARRAARLGLRVALASNGTLIDEKRAQELAAAGVMRVSISIDGADAQTHDGFRGVPGAFEAALAGARHVRAAGMQLQFNATIARHNVDQLERLVELALAEDAQALHLFMLVPVGCGLTLEAERQLSPVEYERVLRWFARRSMRTPLEMRATCAPHYYRILRQMGVKPPAPPHGARAGAHPAAHGATHAAAHAVHTAALTKGCLAGTGVCFISHRGTVQPCGYLPLTAGDLRRQTFREVWEGSELFQMLRDPSRLQGRCGACEYADVCSGCRARAYGMTGDAMAEEPFCLYQPRALRRAGGHRDARR